jgi:hypothetical protein
MKIATEQRDLIALTPWDRPRGCEGILTLEGAIRGMQECGLNLAGFVRPEDLDVCHRYGLKAIVRDPRAGEYDWRNVDPDQLERSLRSLIAEVGAHPALFGYFLKDEPSAEEFPGLAVAVNTLARHAPGKLAYINLYPDYATINNPDRVGQLGTDSYQEYLDRFVATVPTPVISYDNYSIEQDYSIRPSYFHNLLAIRRAAQASGRIFWNVVTSNQVRPWRAPPTRASLAFQAYTTLAAGGRGIAYFTYYTGDGSLPESGVYAHGPLWNFQRTAVWTDLQAVNHALLPLLSTLSRLTSTAVLFGPEPPVEGLPFAPGTSVARIESERPLMVGEFRHEDGSAYVMAVNLDLLHGSRFSLKLQSSPGLLQPVAETGGPTIAGNADPRTELEAGHGVLLKVV